MFGLWSDVCSDDKVQINFPWPHNNKSVLHSIQVVYIQSNVVIYSTVGCNLAHIYMLHSSVTEIS